MLSRRNIGEADRLVTFLTPEQGIIKAVAKGVRKIPSVRGGHLEPFSRVVALLSESRAGWYVGGSETQDYYAALRQDEDALQHARNMALVFLQLFDELDPQPVLYTNLLNAWELLPALPAAKRRMVEGAFIMLALQQAGVQPDLQACQECGITKPSDSVILDARAGGWRCLVCHHSLQGTKDSLSPRLFKVIRFLATAPGQARRLRMPEEESYQLLQAVRRCVADIVDTKVYAQ